MTPINHVVFMLQENRSFDHYFGMLNPYRRANGWAVGDDGKEYDLDGIDDKLGTISNSNAEGQAFSLFKLNTACVDDMTSDWADSYSSVNSADFSVNRSVLMDGFVKVEEHYSKTCSSVDCSSGSLTDDMIGQRAMGYYDQSFLNYYYYMASQFAVSDRWFSPVSSESTPNRIATLTGGTTQGLVHDPFAEDNLNNQLTIPTIFGLLDKAGVSWKLYYSVTDSGCDASSASGCPGMPQIVFAFMSDSFKYLNAPTGNCQSPTVGSNAVGDPTNSFCIDPNHIAPLRQYFTDAGNGTLPSFAFIESAYGLADEHPESTQSLLNGQVRVAKVINALMSGSSWKDSVFFLSYDEPGGPYDHVPPVAGHTNDHTNAAMGITSDIASIAVNADSFMACAAATPTAHCDLKTTDPGAISPSTDAPTVKGFAAQLGSRVPNIIISPFAKRHYVSHTPMDHTAIIQFVENRFVNPAIHLTKRDGAQPDLLEFFDFKNVPWKTPPTQTSTPPPVPVAPSPATCTPAKMQ